AEFDSAASEFDEAASAEWYLSQHERRWPGVFPAFLGTTAVFMFLSATTATAFSEDSPYRHKRVSTSSAISEAAPIGRKITRAEALRIARRIMEQAEHERLAVAQNEGELGLHWD